MCGIGKGKDTYTSGFEGTWTTRPTMWDNEYFKVRQELAGGQSDAWSVAGSHYHAHMPFIIYTDRSTGSKCP